MSAARTNPHQARVAQMVGHAEITDRAGLHGARDRFIRFAVETLDTQRVPQAAAYRARLDTLTGATR